MQMVSNECQYVCPGCLSALLNEKKGLKILCVLIVKNLVYGHKKYNVCVYDVYMN